jgi:tRNA A37 methylthiotransferase MiaB/MoaA/NifB/PqqE/SkfB family radical SAM enzyme
MVAIRQPPMTDTEKQSTGSYTPDNVHYAFADHVDFGDKKVCGIKLSYRCNNNCLYCSCGHDRPDRMPACPLFLSDVSDLLPRLREENVEVVSYLGGEPTIHPEIVDIVALTASYGFREVGVASNGRRFAYPSFTRAMINAGLTNAQITVHAHQAEMADYLAQTAGVLDQQKRGLSNLRQMGLEFLDIVVVVTAVNVQHLSEIYTMLRRWSPSRVTFSLCIPSGAARDNASLLLPSLEATLSQIDSVIAIKSATDDGPALKLRGFPFCQTEPSLWPLFDCYQDGVNMGITPDDTRILHDHVDEVFCDQCTKQKLCTFPRTLLTPSMLVAVVGRAGKPTRQNRVYFCDLVSDCGVNASQTARALAFLEANGYSISSQPTGCGTALVNTCCVVQSRIEAAKEKIRLLASGGCFDRIVVVGCAARIVGESSYGCTTVAGIKPMEMGELNRHFIHHTPIEKIAPRRGQGNVSQAYAHEMFSNSAAIPISQGCEQSCTFCNIRSAKGATQSRSFSRILSEVHEEIERGAEDIILLADDCGSYGTDIDTDIVVLLEAILRVSQSFMVQISSFYPGKLLQLYPALRSSLACQRIRYLSVPIQSASPRVLSLMNRDYDLCEIESVIEDIRRLSPQTLLNTHVLFNFPTESRQEFLETLRFVDIFDEVHFFNYCDTAGTLASGIYPKVVDWERDSRIKEVQRLLLGGQRGTLMQDTVQGKP